MPRSCATCSNVGWRASRRTTPNRSEFERGDGRGWLLADVDLVTAAKTQLPAQAMWFQRVQNAGLLATAKRGGTIEEVAEAAGIEPAGLRATVDKHNAAIASGSPDPFGKHDDFRRPVERPAEPRWDCARTPTSAASRSPIAYSPDAERVRTQRRQVEYL